MVLKEASIVEMSDDKLELFITRICMEMAKTESLDLGFDQIVGYSKQVFYGIRGYGLLENLLLNPTINEIMVNDIDHIFIEEKGIIKQLKSKIESVEEYYRIINKIVSQSGREVNLANPIVDARLEENGARVNVVLPPIAKDQPVLTIRKFPEKHIDMEYLTACGTISKQAADFLKSLVQAKYNIMIGGGTSSGKTTFLNALSEFIGQDERIITIEDSRELQLIGKSNLISLETRNSNTSNRGAIGIKDLIKTSLRMRPDRIIVGEVRADEAVDMLMALNTGHDGGLTTAHANSCKDMISRLETMVLRAGDNIPLEAVKRMIASSINIVIQLSKLASNKRKLVEISELSFVDDRILINQLYLYNKKEDKLMPTGNKLIRREKLHES